PLIVTILTRSRPRREEISPSSPGRFTSISYSMYHSLNLGRLHRRRMRNVVLSYRICLLKKRDRRAVFATKGGGPEPGAPVCRHLSDIPAAIYPDDFPGDVPRLFSEQEIHGTGHILRRAGTHQG